MSRMRCAAIAAVTSAIVIGSAAHAETPADVLERLIPQSGAGEDVDYFVPDVDLKVTGCELAYITFGRDDEFDYSSVRTVDAGHVQVSHAVLDYFQGDIIMPMRSAFKVIDVSTYSNVSPKAREKLAAMHNMRCEDTGCMFQREYSTLRMTIYPEYQKGKPAPLNDIFVAMSQLAETCREDS
ncbi:MAG: hypothetical protein JJ869_08210 [Marivita sp.]|uniref:hypothetical protein n=1 Tax=Marivita sp. TaxID=2003365 RepID=UPI001B0A839C|nr:hypothetical protein [Marivita sp.]MBO6883549.1 hypothetical protein [Marivita sp.]